MRRGFYALWWRFCNAGVQYNTGVDDGGDGGGDDDDVDDATQVYSPASDRCTQSMYRRALVELSSSGWTCSLSVLVINDLPAAESDVYQYSHHRHHHHHHHYYKLINYEGCSINKLQNDIILSIFKIWKLGNIRFVGNLIGDIYWNFCNDDVITVTSLVLRTQSVIAVFCPAVFFCNSQVLKSIASWEKSEQVRQANVFKCQTLTFHFYRATRMQSADYAVARCLSVGPSVTRRYCV